MTIILQGCSRGIPLGVGGAANVALLLGLAFTIFVIITIIITFLKGHQEWIFTSTMVICTIPFIFF